MKTDKISSELIQHFPKRHLCAPLRSYMRTRVFENTQTIFEPNGAVLPDYVINPQWLSEDVDPIVQMSPRRFRPWAYEFQGARRYPWGCTERKLLTARMGKKDEPKSDDEEEEKDTSASAPTQCVVSAQHIAPWDKPIRSTESYRKPDRIPPDFRSLWRPREERYNIRPFEKSIPKVFKRVDNGNYMEFHPPGINTEGFCRSKLAGDPLKEQSATGTEVYYPTTYKPGEAEMTPIMMPPPTAPVKKPHMNMANVSWINTFNADKHNKTRQSHS